MSNTITLNIQEENGEIRHETVSEDFMELCFRQAQHILNESKSPDDIFKLVDEATSNRTTRLVILDMITHQLRMKNRKQDVAIALLKEMLSMFGG